MDGSAEALEEMKQHWRDRIVQECETMHNSIESLRELAKAAGDEKIAKKIDDLHTLYCEMANTITLRLLLNGAMETLGCENKAESP